MSILENVIMLAIMTIALFGAIEAQNLALKNLHTLNDQNKALELAHALMERFRTVQSVAEMSREYNSFETQLSLDLPKSYSKADCAYPRHECSIRIFWQDPNNQSVSLSSLI